MILRRNFDFLQNKSRYKYIQELKVQRENPESKTLVDNYGNICFIGNVSKCRKVNLTNFFTGKEAGNSLYVDCKYIRDEEDIEFNGIFADSKMLKGDETVVFDLSKCGQLHSDYIDLVFQMTQTALLHSYKKLFDNGIMKENYAYFEPFSRIRIHLNNLNTVFYAEKYKRSLEPVKVITKNLNGKEHCVAYSGANNRTVIDGNVMPLVADELTDKLDVLAVACRTLKDTDAAVQLNDCVTVIGSSGYLYLEPFSVPDIDTADAKIEIVANRQLPLEIYDEEQNQWILFESGIIAKSRKIQDIKLRIGVETGDSVRNVIFSAM